MFSFPDENATSLPHLGSTTLCIETVSTQERKLAAISYLDVVSVKVSGENELAALEVFVQIQNRAEVPPRVRWRHLHARPVYLQVAVVCVNRVAQISAVLLIA